MLFNSITFILLFLPVALAGFYGLARVGPRWAAAWLVLVSFVFYSWWAAGLVFLLAGSIAFNFGCGTAILRAGESDRWKGLFLIFGVTGNLLTLFYFKYFFPLVDWFSLHGFIAGPLTYSVILPLGISFFTFTQIGYLVDCKGGVVKTSNFLDYCLFVTFFPHLIAGPILHHREILPQFANPETYRFQYRNLAVGVTLFLMGLAKKDFLADSLAPHANAVFSNLSHPSLLESWNGTLSYSLQLYFDFSGYSDMAIGLALMFGVRFPANFDSPYRAASIIDFWQRWHMTLTRYLTLYLYNPVALAVSRYRMAHGKSVSRQAISTVEGFVSMIAFPTIYTMALAGIWHGAGLQFMIFGLLHGIYLVINHAYRSFGPRVPSDPPHPLWRFSTDVAKIAMTYLAVLVAQVFFRASSVHEAIEVLKGMTGLYGLAHGHAFKEMSPLPSARWIVCLGILFSMVWLMPNSLQILRKYEPCLSKLRSTSLLNFEWKPTLAWSFATALVALIALLDVTGVTEFIYFRF
jgi:D-alanyl-lipoteichoic acid acyltransferase DltB (MBOAT superfamily)